MTDFLPEIISLNQTAFIRGRNIIDNSLLAQEMTKEIWDKIRTQGHKVHWHRLIWYPMHLPKHSLIAWMTILNRLPTSDRLQRMGISTDGICINCRIYQETRDHLFSQYSLVVELWKSILNLNGMNYTALTWDEMVSRASSTWKGKSLITIILKILWNAFIYSLWQERNRRMFQGRSRTVDIMLKEIIEVVSIMLRGKSINRLDSANFYLCNA
ncbi:uncharacterized protein LOC120198064 [Hibiscus syriacus]|uniref:uncharacterized protein LOC120198064 n=1 Tax=Hibiscus syriacus TaxID=106335 RepID=UPI001921D1FC|nr:uncharacterized protein LOC120198064 [Hibiscus syriacus]